MKVLLINGSPHAQGSTYTALSEVADALERNGVEAQIFQSGTEPIAGCLGCRACRKTGECVIRDRVFDLVEAARDADGFVVGSPVYFAAANGHLSNLLSRALYSGMLDVAGKPGAAVVVCRRGGASAAFDQINKFFGITGMLTVGSQYWNSVHGTCPEEVRRDEEGLQTLRTLAGYMAWILKCIEAGREAGIEFPGPEMPHLRTSFIDPLD